MNNFFKQEKMTLAKATRVMARDTKKLMQKCIAVMVEQYGFDIEDLDDENLKLFRDAMALYSKCFDLMELSADAMEEQDRKIQNLDEKLDLILKEVKKK